MILKDELEHLIREHKFYLELLKVPLVNSGSNELPISIYNSIENTKYKIYLLEQTTWLQESLQKEDKDFSDNKVAKEELLESFRILKKRGILG